jgi:hypothetical protein
MKDKPLQRRLAIAGAIALACSMPAAHAAPALYNVTQTYNQVVYDVSHPTWDTIFTGSFVFDATTGTVSNLSGSLSQAMSGNTTFRQLGHQLSTVYDATLGGFLVSSFYQDSSDVFQGGGFATGGTVAFGNQNAYVTVFVNASDPTAVLTAAQTDKLAYADCTTGGLMGRMNKCMTGWVDHAKLNLAGGTMQGTYPITQTITAAVPEPESYALMLAGLGLMGTRARRRKAKRTAPIPAARSGKEAK